MATSLEQQRAAKFNGQRFWNANPCGGKWATYANFMAWIQRTEAFAFDMISRHDWTSKRVLDVGCGQGTLLNYLPHLGATVFGLDMSPVSLQRAAAGANELGHPQFVHLAVADAERLPFPDKCFDTVLSFGVLHHTPDTRGGVNELWRVLKPNGLAVVMLYRSGNPKWWMTHLIRIFHCLVDLCTGETDTIATYLRKRHGIGDRRGTALLELFGVPILKAFSNKQANEMFTNFSQVQISNHEPGFRRMVDIIPVLKAIEPFLHWFDQRFNVLWGFYQVIEAIK
jgi:SAM-dependent methyltransferase